MTKTTVTIAIPAYNEAANISNILEAIIMQNTRGFLLEKILVLTDGCTDSTESEVSKMTRKFKLIKRLSFGERQGKVARLNQIYNLCNSDILLTFDGDIYIDDRYLVSRVVREFQLHPKTQVLAIHQVPLEPDNFVGKIIYAGYDFWDRARLSIKNQDHIQNLYGAATGYRREFYKDFWFPQGITDDRGYLYIKAKQTGGFKYLKSTRIYYLPVSTLRDFWRIGDRSFNKNEEVLGKYFGEIVYKLYEIPLTNKLNAISETLIRNPFYGSLALLINILSRLFPVHDELYDSKMWSIAFSTKKKIILKQ